MEKTKQTLRQILAKMKIKEIEPNLFEIGGRGKPLEHDELALLMEWVSEQGESSRIVRRYYRNILLNIPEVAANVLRKQIEIDKLGVEQTVDKIEGHRESLVRMCVTQTSTFDTFLVRGWDLEDIATAQEVTRALKGWAAERGGQVVIIGRENTETSEKEVYLRIRATKKFAYRLRDILKKKVAKI